VPTGRQEVRQFDRAPALGATQRHLHQLELKNVSGVLIGAERSVINPPERARPGNEALPKICSKVDTPCSGWSACERMLQRHAIRRWLAARKETDGSTQDSGYQRKATAQDAGQFNYRTLASLAWLPASR
jgi:hypothetical protein